jgi:hypothetical protein
LRTGESLILIVRSVAAIVYAIPVRHLSTYVGRRCVFIVTGLLRLVLLPLCFIGIAGASQNAMQVTGYLILMTVQSPAATRHC